jgi:hypothetical protein
MMVVEMNINISLKKIDIERKVDGKLKLKKKLI